MLDKASLEWIIRRYNSSTVKTTVCFIQDAIRAWIAQIRNQYIVFFIFWVTIVVYLL